MEESLWKNEKEGKELLAPIYVSLFKCPKYNDVFFQPHFLITP